MPSLDRFSTDLTRDRRYSTVGRTVSSGCTSISIVSLIKLVMTVYPKDRERLLTERTYMKYDRPERTSIKWGLRFDACRLDSYIRTLDAYAIFQHLVAFEYSLNTVLKPRLGARLQHTGCWQLQERIRAYLRDANGAKARGPAQRLTWTPTCGRIRSNSKRTI